MVFNKKTVAINKKTAINAAINKKTLGSSVTTFINF